MNKPNNKKNIKKQQKNNKTRNIMIGSVSVIALLTVILVFALPKANNDLTSGDSTSITTSGKVAQVSNMTINKSDITSKVAKFYPVTVDGTKMEILALKASDGTIRTAFNTCQVCYTSGRGYYKLEGDTLVCQNCGNRFTPDQVAQQKGGCNPVPILESERTDSGSSITIGSDFLLQSKALVASWKS